MLSRFLLDWSNWPMSELVSFLTFGKDELGLGIRVIFTGELAVLILSLELTNTFNPTAVPQRAAWGKMRSTPPCPLGRVPGLGADDGEALFLLIFATHGADLEGQLAP